MQDDNGAYHANFENLNWRQSGASVNIGNPLARGKITEIQQDQVAYEANPTGKYLGADRQQSDWFAQVQYARRILRSDSGGAPVDPNAPGLTDRAANAMRGAMQQMNSGSSAPSTSVPERNPTPTVQPPAAPPQCLAAATGAGTAADGCHKMFTTVTPQR